MEREREREREKGEEAINLKGYTKQQNLRTGYRQIETTIEALLKPQYF